jgi:hypothetical protein
VFFPWAFDFSRFFGLNVYENENAFVLSPAEIPFWARNPSGWTPLERNMARATDGSPLVTFRQVARLDAVLGKAPGGELSSDDAIFSPVGADGYPRPLFDRWSGQIDPEIAECWRLRGDLAYYLEQNWTRIGPNLVGKLHFYVGDMDHFRRNEGVRKLEVFFEGSHSPHVESEFRYGLFKGDYQPMSNAELVVLIADRMSRHSRGTSSVSRRSRNELSGEGLRRP